MKDMNLDIKRYAPRAVAGLISQAKNELQGPADFVQSADNQFNEFIRSVNTTTKSSAGILKLDL